MRLKKKKKVTDTAFSPKKSVAGVLFDQNRNRVLLIKRRDVPVWVLPGGGIDPRETPEEAIVREFFEETGLRVAITRQVAYYTPINRLSYPLYFFECTTIDGALSKGSETGGIDFFSLEELPSPLFFLHREWIEDARALSSEVIYKPLNQITYFNLFKYFLSHPLQVLRLLLSRCGLPLNTKSD